MVRTVLKPMLPVVRAWMDQTLATHLPNAQRLDEFKFSGLPRYFSRELYSSVKVVIADPLPLPPFSTLAVAVFRQNSNFGGITYNDVYFLKPAESNNEATHFHEMIHVIQWRHLGVDEFLLAYAMSLLSHGYWNHPFEVMARAHQNRFVTEPNAYETEEVVASEMGLLPTLV